MNRHRKWLLAALIATTALIAAWGIWYGWRYLNTPPSVRALPRSATDIHEYYEDSGFPLYDYARYMKARIPQSEFAAYAKRLGLRPRRAGEIPLSWIAGDPAWWNPTESQEETWRRIDSRDSGVQAKWENGWVYVYDWSN
jgi:hypothetical protein